VPKLTAEHRQVLEDVAQRYRAAAEAGARSPVRVLIEQLGVPEATVRHWVRRRRELGLLPGDQTSDRKAGWRGLSPKSVWNVHICLPAALNDAIEDGLIRTNPASGLMKEPSGHREMKTWTVEELRAFLHFVRDHRNFALYRLAAHSGMRRGHRVDWSAPRVADSGQVFCLSLGGPGWLDHRYLRLDHALRRANRFNV
jgi:hypothetical protein